jgi:hypothetical protein
VTEERVPIPYCYVWMTEGYNERGKLFKQYVTGYIKSNFPGLTLVKIEGMTAICEVLPNDKGIAYEKRKKAK